MTYLDSIKLNMNWLGEQKDTVFLGQGIVRGDRMYHTLDEVPTNKCVEMPVAENLIMGVANGLAVKGYRPIVVFQRMDFMLIAADQIINHTALMEEMSNSQFKCPVIIRTCIGSQSKKFDVGRQHNHDFRHVFSPYLAVINYVPGVYHIAHSGNTPCIIVEEKDLYAKTV